MANRGGFYFRLLGGDDAVDGGVARGALGEMEWLRSTSPGWASAMRRAGEGMAFGALVGCGELVVDGADVWGISDAGKPQAPGIP